MTKAIRETLGNPDVVEYCDSVADFFFPENYIMYEMSMGEELLKELEGYFEEGGIENDGRSLRVIIQYIDSALRTIELYWSEATSNYARLRVNYLLSQQIKFKNS